MTKENREILYHELFDAMCNRGNPEWMLLDLEKLYVELKNTEDALFMRKAFSHAYATHLKRARKEIEELQAEIRCMEPI